MKKIMKIILAVVTALTAAMAGVGATGCDPTVMAGYYYPEYESGYFKYAVKTEKDGTEKAYLIGLTESGMEQTELIYPEEIDGIAVYGIGYSIPRVPGYEDVGDFGSENLKKLFFLNSPKERHHSSSVVSFDKTYMVYWNLGDKFMGVFGAAGTIYGYEYYHWDNSENGLISVDTCLIANVTYRYNYENSPNSDCYWVDSYDESEITFIPPEPQREGYKFDGWYKEAECINEWDFETDKTGKEIKIKPLTFTDIYEGVYLYAKWIKN